MIEALVVAILGTALGSLLGRESSAVLSLLSRGLLDQGLRRLLRRWPPEARERWREEIEADFETYSERPLASLVFALRLRWTTRRRPLRRAAAFLADAFENTLDELSEEEKAERRLIVLRAMGNSSPMMRAYRAAEVIEQLRREPDLSRGNPNVERPTSTDRCGDGDGAPE
jgi:hypothetical protein